MTRSRSTPVRTQRASGDARPPVTRGCPLALKGGTWLRERERVDREGKWLKDSKPAGEESRKGAAIDAGAGRGRLPELDEFP